MLSFCRGRNLKIRWERRVELVLEGLRFDNLVQCKHGELMEMVWNGFYVPALKQPFDLNDDGKKDVNFYAPAPRKPGVTYLNVSATLSDGIRISMQLSNGTCGAITWLNNMPRQWK